MKKVFALLLTALLLVPFALPAAIAAEGDKKLPLIIVNGIGESPLLTPEGDVAFPPSADKITKAVLKLVPITPLLALSPDKFGDLAYPILRELFDDIACDPDGTPKNDIGQLRFPDSYAKDKTGMIDTISQGGLALRYGEDRTYQYVVDWRVSGLTEAEGLHTMIERVKKEHKVKKVNIICISMGGATAMGYLAKYGHGSIQNLVLMHTVFQGMNIVGDLFNGRLTFTSENLRRWVSQSLEGNDPWQGVVDTLLEVFDRVGALGGVLGLADKMVQSLSPRIDQEFIIPIFGQLPGFWGCVPAEDYESAKALQLDPVKHAGLIAQADEYHHNVMDKAPALFKKAMAAGTNVYVLSGCNLAGAPVGPHANAHTDDGLSTATTSGGAVCAPLGETLGENYTQAKACGHNHLSPDGFIDASTCMLPEQTWFQKDMHHTNFRTEYSIQFLHWLLADSARKNVRTNPAYPQFLQLKDGKLLALGGGERLTVGNDAPGVPGDSADGITNENTTPPVSIPDTGDHWMILLLLVTILGIAAVTLKKSSSRPPSPSPAR